MQRLGRNTVDDYKHFGPGHDLGFPGKPFFLDLEWCDATPPPGSDYTRWSMRQRPGIEPECSFIVFVTGADAKTGGHPIPMTALPLMTSSRRPSLSASGHARGNRNRAR